MPLLCSVSIHAPREGCDKEKRGEPMDGYQFQFTHPGRGATNFALKLFIPTAVSIHAPREGCDEKERILNRLQRVSIHAPREGCDLLPLYSIVGQLRFNSRTPGGVRRIPHSMREEVARFNSRTPGGVRQCAAKLRIMGRINKRNLRLEVLL